MKEVKLVLRKNKYYNINKDIKSHKDGKNPLEQGI